MSRLERYRVPSASHLLHRIFDTPALVSAVRELPAPALAQLIDHVGLEDAGELVALASTEQLHQVFDEQLFHGAAGGDEERFSPERFALWLSVMSEAGDDFVARTLSELPADVLTLAVQSAVLVLDMEALSADLEGDPWAAELAEKALEGVACEEWEEFALIARDESSWDVLWPALLALDRDHHECLRGVLERCAWLSRAAAQECGGVHELLTEEELLSGQVADARDERRAGRGYVSAADARAFLALCRLPAEGEGRDPITLAYFRRLERAPIEPAPKDREVDPRTDATQEAANKLGSLLQVLQEAEVLPASTAAPIGLLTAGAVASADESPGLTALMPELLQRDPARHGDVIEELGFLANVLIAIAGRTARTRPVDAMMAAVHVCDLGLDGVSEADTRAARLRALSQVSADRLFRRGVQTLLANPEARQASALAPFSPFLCG